MDDQFHNYEPQHEITPNYASGMKAIREGRLTDAIAIFAQEPDDSPCFGLALANSALCFMRLNQYVEAERMALHSERVMQFWCPHPPTGVQALRNLAEAVAFQGRLAESNDLFNRACLTADALCAQHVEFEKSILLAKAHVLSSWGGAHLQASRHTKNYKVALDLFNKARDIYRQHGGIDQIGLSEVLTNCGHAYKLSGQITEAELSFVEALEVSKTDDQSFRIQLCLIQIDSATIQNPKEILLQAAQHSEAGNRFGTAYTRYAIAASWAVEKKETSFGLNCIAKACAIQSKLDRNDPFPADLKMTEAQLLFLANPSSKLPSKVLIEGAHLWYSRLENNFAADDLLMTTSNLHEHFRFLARTLLDEGRIEEALVGFECGRSLKYSIELDSSIQLKLLSKNPFAHSGDKINCDLLKEMQKNLGPEEAIVLITIIPPEIVAFIITTNSVQTVTQIIPVETIELAKFDEALKAIPSRLRERVGLRAIPETLQALALDIKSHIGAKKIISLIPSYAQLHLVPWRVLLKENGMSWSQLVFATEFTLISRFFSSQKSQHHSEICFALGNGVAGEINLNEEAQLFAEMYGSNGNFISNCSPQDITYALSQKAVVLISCHGIVSKHLANGKLMLTLNNQNVPINDLFPEKVNSPLVILSACHSGVYEMHWSDYPEGAAPDLLRLGVKNCVATRYQVNAPFAKCFVIKFSAHLKKSGNIALAFSNSLYDMEALKADIWRDLACFEILSQY